MKASIIGKSAYGNDVYLGTPENLHMYALGTSGAGKSNYY